MEQKFIAAWENNRSAAALMGIRMRPLDVAGAKRVLSGNRLSDGFNELKAKGALKNAIIGFVLIFVLILALNLLMPIMIDWVNANAGTTIVTN